MEPALAAWNRARAYFRGSPHPHEWAVWLLVTPVLWGVALALDFLPLEVSADDGATTFALGFPLRLATYDPRTGLETHRLLAPVLFTQLLLYLAATGVVAWRHRRAGAQDT